MLFSRPQREDQRHQSTISCITNPCIVACRKDEIGQFMHLPCATSLFEESLTDVVSRSNRVKEVGKETLTSDRDIYNLSCTWLVGQFQSDGESYRSLSTNTIK